MFQKPSHWYGLNISHNFSLGNSSGKGSRDESMSKKFLIGLELSVIVHRKYVGNHVRVYAQFYKISIGSTINQCFILNAYHLCDKNGNKKPYNCIPSSSFLLL